MNVDQRLVGRVWNLLRARDSYRPRPAGLKPTGLSIVDVADGPTELMIYQEIGFWGVTAQDIVDQLSGRRGDLHVRINSGGGDVFDGYAIFNALVAHDGAVTVTVEGLAASAASFIAMAGDTIQVCLASQMMIHDASGGCYGNEREMREWADVLGSVSDTIAGVYAERGGGDAASWRDVMRAERWYTPQEAVDAGLADKVITPSRAGRQPVEPDQPEEPDESPGMQAVPVLVVASDTRPQCVAVLNGVRCAFHALADSDRCKVHTPATADHVDGDDGDGGDTGGKPTADSSWLALIASLTTPKTAPSTVDELLNALVQKGKTS